MGRLVKCLVSPSDRQYIKDWDVRSISDDVTAKDVYIALSKSLSDVEVGSEKVNTLNNELENLYGKPRKADAKYGGTDLDAFKFWSELKDSIIVCLHPTSGRIICCQGIVGNIENVVRQMNSMQILCL